MTENRSSGCSFQSARTSSINFGRSAIIWMMFLGCISLTTGKKYTCLNEEWRDSCQIGDGRDFSSVKYKETTSGALCDAGSVCDFEDMPQYTNETLEPSAWCQVSRANGTRYEACNIPRCSDLPPCDARLYLLDERIPFADGVAWSYIRYALWEWESKLKASRGTNLAIFHSGAQLGTNGALDQTYLRTRIRYGEGTAYRVCAFQLQVSTPQELVNALRVHKVSEVVFTMPKVIGYELTEEMQLYVWEQRDLKLLDTDLGGYPIFFMPGREIIINKRGTTMFMFIYTGAIPTMFVTRNASVIGYRGISVGNPFVSPAMKYELHHGTSTPGLYTFKMSDLSGFDGRFKQFRGNYSFYDSYITFDSCLAYDRMFGLLATGASVSGSVEDSTFVFDIPGFFQQPAGTGYHHGSVIMENFTFTCAPFVFSSYPPAPLPSTNTSSADSTPPNHLANKPSDQSSTPVLSTTFIGVIIAAAAFVLILCAIAYYRYDRCSIIGTGVSDLGISLQPRTSGWDGSVDEIDSSILTRLEGGYMDWRKRKNTSATAQLNHGSSHVTSETHHTLASLVTVISELGSKQSSTRLHQVEDFERLASSVVLGIAPEHLDTEEAPQETLEAGSLSDDSPGSSLKWTDNETCYDAQRTVMRVPSRVPPMSNMVCLPEPAQSASDVLRSGIVVNGYEFIKDLGAGGFGEVHLVRDVISRIKYTMKVPKRAAVQPVVKEAYLLAMLKHPNIVWHKETFVTNGQLVVVMEWCKYGDLAMLMERFNNAPPPERFLRSVLFQLAYGVAHMHSSGVAHRDIKPANIFISDNGLLKLGDLGSGRVLLNMSDTFVGTPMFMAPEVLYGETYSKECDIYSLGSVLYMLCAGKPAYVSAKNVFELKELHQERVDTSSLAHLYSAELLWAINYMMAPETERPTAAEIVGWEWLYRQPRTTSCESEILNFSEEILAQVRSPANQP